MVSRWCPFPVLRQVPACFPVGFPFPVLLQVPACFPVGCPFPALLRVPVFDPVAQPFLLPSQHFQGCGDGAARRGCGAYCRFSCRRRGSLRVRAACVPGFSAVQCRYFFERSCYHPHRLPACCCASFAPASCVGWIYCRRHDFPVCAGSLLLRACIRSSRGSGKGHRCRSRSASLPDRPGFGRGCRGSGFGCGRGRGVFSRLDGSGLFVTHVVQGPKEFSTEPQGFKIVLIQLFLLPITRVINAGAAQNDSGQQ